MGKKQPREYVFDPSLGFEIKKGGEIITIKPTILSRQYTPANSVEI